MQFQSEFDTNGHFGAWTTAGGTRRSLGGHWRWGHDPLPLEIIHERKCTFWKCESCVTYNSIFLTSKLEKCDVKVQVWLFIDFWFVLQCLLASNCLLFRHLMSLVCLLRANCLLDIQTSAIENFDFVPFKMWNCDLNEVYVFDACYLLYCSFFFLLPFFFSSFMCLCVDDGGAEAEEYPVLPSLERRFLVFVSPKSGPGKSLQLWQKIVEPLFKQVCSLFVNLFSNFIVSLDI